jgi:hypothetical protein
MKKEIAMRWVEALRSGDYKQGTEQLRDKNNNFCCLGVLCNLHAQDHPEIAAVQKNQITYLGTYAFPRRTVYQWAGLKEGVGLRLASMNDDGRTFKQLARYIAANWEKL